LDGYNEKSQAAPERGEHATGALTIQLETIWSARRIPLASSHPFQSRHTRD